MVTTKNNNEQIDDNLEVMLYFHIMRSIIVFTLYIGYYILIITYNNYVGVDNQVTPIGKLSKQRVAYDVDIYDMSNDDTNTHAFNTKLLKKFKIEKE